MCKSKVEGVWGLASHAFSVFCGGMGGGNPFPSIFFYCKAYIFSTLSYWTHLPHIFICDHVPEDITTTTVVLIINFLYISNCIISYNTIMYMAVPYAKVSSILYKNEKYIYVLMKWTLVYIFSL